MIPTAHLRNRDSVALVEPGRIHPAASFARSTTATYVGPSGLIVPAAINAPRYEYTSAGALLGLLIEDQRTNLFLQSGRVDLTPWGAGRLTARTVGTLAPDGSTNGVKLQANTEANPHLITLTLSQTIGQKYCISGYFKADEWNTVFMFAESGTQGATFNVANGTIYSGGASARIVPVGGGWYRASVVYTALTATSVFSFRIGLNNAQNTAGDGTTGVHVWGVQFEAGDSVTSYIPTTTTAVTRGGDICSIPLAAIGYNSAESTFFAEHDMLWITSGSDRYLLAIDGSGRAIYSSGGFNLSVYDGTNIASSGAISAAMGKTATAFSAAGMAMSSRGSAVATTSFDGVFGAGGSTLRIGSNNGPNAWQGHIKRARYYPRRLPNTDLLALSS